MREDALKYAISLFEVRKGRRIVEFTKEKVLVGRDTKECDLVLDPLDLSASRIHLAIAKHGDAFHLENLSKNGTAVNGALVGRSGRRLYHGDLIEAGNAELTFMLTSEVETAGALFEEGKRSEQLDPSYAVQCYALAHRQCPSEVKYAAALLRILEQEGRIEELVTGGGLFDPEGNSGDIIKDYGKKSGHLPLPCVPGENPEPVTGLGAAAGRRQAHKEIR